MSKLILCIDDEPIRYRRLSQLMAVRDIVVVTTCRMEDFEEYMVGPHDIMGVCLDHDMPFASGKVFAKTLREKNIPVTITSLNLMGAERISDILNEYETPNLKLPCTTTDWEVEAETFWEFSRV